jgi:nitrite reductase (NO-forming)
VSSFHVIGEIFDKVFKEGASEFNTNIQTTLVPAGGSAIVEFKLEVPGNFVIVDHSIFRTFNKGALGLIKVEGSGDKTVFSGKTADNVYMPEGGAIQKVVDKEQVATASTLEDQLKFGKTIYAQNCAACHQPDGKGIVGAFPPLASSDFFNADWKRSIDVVKNGLSGAVTVNGQLYNGVMPALGLSDEDISNVLTYISHSWGNKKRIFKKPEVSSVSTRKDKGGGH